MYREKDNIIKKRTTAAVRSIIFIFLIVINLVPFYWGAVTSIKPIREIFIFPPRIVGFTPSIEHYKIILNSGFLGNVRNSIFYSLGAIIFGLLLALIAAYGFERYRFRFRNLLFYIVIAGIPLAIGSAAMLIPNYIYMSKLGLTNHWYTLIILYATYSLPMSIWIIKGAIKAIPIEIEEAAMIDGATRPYIIFNLIPTLCRPSIAAAALFIFIFSWNEFIISSVMINASKLRPIQLAIYNYLGFYGQEWGPLTAASIIAVIPILIVFSLLAKLLISGLTQGSVKG